MEFPELLMIGTGVGSIALWIAWIKDYGLGRGSLAMLCRIVWLLPLALAFLPEIRSEEIPRTLALKALPLLVDDSESMNVGRSGNGVSFKESSERLIQTIASECLRLGCQPKVTRLSELSAKVKSGFTPLALGLDAWFYSVGSEPWIVMSDGGDSEPTEPWDHRLHHQGLGPDGKTRGLIVGFRPSELTNIWIEMSDAPLFSFEDKPLELSVVLKRENPDLSAEATQVQVISGDKVLATADASFLQGQKEITLSLPIPALPRGQHLLTIKALPTTDDRSIWDNTVQKVVEVMPNTVGVLHLLGAPSWDGRFLRRYLKSEPKYDLISFFILRDPGDMQVVSERELSLIPFPVDRLFNEELPNFHAVVLQNFTLFQFLEPAYQANLVKFVQEGGGLIFLGGPRALQTADYTNTPLAAILPFETIKGPPGSPVNDTIFNGFREAQVNTTGPWYDESLKFKVELASPSPEERSLANVYEEWEGLAESLRSQNDLAGLHHMENVTFKKGESTPLLNARLENGKLVPLAVASYPGKGRAIWIFSDTLWRFALNPPPSSSREVYSDFMRSSLNWLLRQELSKPLLIRDFHLSATSNGRTGWRLKLFGPAARFFHTDGEWKVSICGTALNLNEIAVEKQGEDSWLLAGELGLTLAGGTYCLADIQGVHPAFGSVRSTLPTVMTETYSDLEMIAAPNKLAALARLTGAELVPDGGMSSEAVSTWLGQVTGQSGVALAPRIKTIKDYFWALDRSWFFVLLLCLPLEVVVRRWPQLMSDRRSKA